MKKKNLQKYYFLLITIIIVSIFGCTTARNVYEAGSDTARTVYRTVTPGKEAVLKKRVLVVPIIDHAGLGEDLANQLTDELITKLQTRGKLLVHKSDLEISRELKKRSPQFGIVVDPELAKKAAELGMNALITSVLNPLESKIKTKYFWPIKKVKREVEVSMVVNVFDPINGTLYLTNMESRKKDIETDEFELQQKEWDIDPIVLNQRLRQIIEDQASVINKVLEDQPWTGLIVKINEQGVQINGGKDIGVISGNIFDVYSGGDKIESVSGRTLSLLGPKVGEIQVNDVRENHSLAVKLGNIPLEAGQLIRLKN